MAFTPEDGTGLPDANSYSTVGFADGYFLDRANAVWSGLTDDAKKANLIIATDYIEMRYAERFYGEPLTAEQALSWPRTWQGDPMPPQLARACCEYAVRAVAGPLVNEDVKTSNGYITRKKTQAGPIVNDTSYSGGSYSTSYKSIPSGDTLLEQLCYPVSAGVIR